jgi:hypothetical protein
LKKETLKLKEQTESESESRDSLDITPKKVKLSKKIESTRNPSMSAFMLLNLPTKWKNRAKNTSTNIFIADSFIKTSIDRVEPTFRDIKIKPATREITLSPDHSKIKIAYIY